MKKQVTILILSLLLLGGKAAGQCVTVGANQTICKGGTSAALGGGYINSTTAALWSDGAIGGTFSPNATTLSATWTPPAAYTGVATITLTATADCSTTPLFSTMTVTVDPTSVGGTIASVSAICSGSTPADLVLSGNTGGVVRWESSTVIAFSSPTTIASTSTTLTGATIGALTTSTYFRAVVQSGACSSTTSASVLVTVDPTSVGGTIASVSAICSGSTPADLVLSGNTGGVVRWESSTDIAFSSPTTIASTSTTLTGATIGALTTSTYFRAVVQSGACSSTTSASVLVTVDPTSVGGTIASVSAICSGSTPADLVLSSNTGGVVRWESSTDLAFSSPTTIASTSTTLTGATIGTLTTSTYFRAVVQSGACSSTTSASVLVTVDPTSVGGTIASVSAICSGSTPADLVLSSNTGGVVRWESSTDLAFSSPTTIASTSTTLTGATIGTLTTSTYFRAVVQSGACSSTTSASVLVTVDPTSVGGTIASVSAICSGSTPANLVLSGNTGGVVRWEKSSDLAFTSPTTIASTSTTLTGATIGALTTSTYFRAVVQSGACSSTTSASVLVTVNPPSVGGSVTSDQLICNNTTPLALTLAGYTGTILRWEWASNNGFAGATTIPGETSATLPAAAMGALVSTTYYRAIIKSGACSQAISSSVTISVRGAFSAALTGGTAAICYDSSPGKLTATPTGGEAPYSYQWYTTPANIVSGAISFEYTPVNVTSNTTYYCAVTSSGGCGTTNTNQFAVTVSPQITLTGASQRDQICSESPAIIDLSGLLTSSTFLINYSINSINQSPVSGVVSDGTGHASFNTGNLAAANNGKYLRIDKITTGSAPVCEAVFTRDVFLIVNSATTPTIAGNFAPCVGSTGNVYTTQTGMTNYAWTVSAGGTITAGGGNTDNTVTVTWNTATSQSVSVNFKNENDCSALSPTSKPVEVKALPTPTVSGPLAPCVGSAGNIYTTEANMSDYSWNVSAGGAITPGGVGNFIIVAWNASGSQSVSINYKNGNSCVAATPSIQLLDVKTLPPVTVSGISPVCAGSTGNIYSTQPGMTGYIWEVSSGGTITAGGGSTDNTVTVTWNTVGAQTVKVNYTDGNDCTASASFSKPVVVNALPVPVITGSSAPNVLSTGNIYSTDAGMTGYNWSISAGGSITDGLGTSSVIVTWNNPGSQTISVNYTNGNSCTAVTPTVKTVNVNAKPVAGSISMSGNTKVGSILTANYQYSDADGDLEGASTVQWFRDSNGTGGTWISIAPASTTKTYTLTNLDFGKLIKFELVPIASTGSLTGITYTSSNSAAITNPPPVSSVPVISGIKNVGEALTGSYTYSDAEGDIESGSLYQWYSSPVSGGTFTAISGETLITHLIKDSEQGYYFKFSVTPKTTTGLTTGISQLSAEYGKANTKPYADNVTISGTTSIGFVLTGGFSFHDIDGDAIGTCKFRWLRNLTTPIPGATSNTYFLTPDDEGSKITFEVTPVSNTGYPDTGIPVTSAETASIIDPSTAVPVATEVCIEGIRAKDQILKGKYKYTFYKSEGTSTFKWKRNGITVGTALQYTVTQVDLDSKEDIVFEVTPVSSNIPAKTGLPVNSRPIARITLPQDEYSIAVSEVTLTANETGGVFSGIGVTNGKFSPSDVGTTGSPYTISYLLNIVNTNTTCSQQASTTVNVVTNTTAFSGINPAYCHDGGDDVISVTGVPPGSTSYGFYLTDPDAIVAQTAWTVTINPGLMRPGVNRDILYFTYYTAGYYYQISQQLVVDSVGTDLKFINIDSAYCAKDAKQEISVVGVYPLGGNGTWTGTILSNPKTTTADLDPQAGTAGTSYLLTYQYQSPSLCLSKVIDTTIIINPLPNPNFTLNPYYNVDGGDITLIPDQSGGTFYGSGISGSTLIPTRGTLGERTITYSITDSNNCSAFKENKTTILKAVGTIGVPSIICYRDTIFNVVVTDLPKGRTVTSFTNLKNSLIHVAGDTTAIYSVTAAGAGEDKLTLAYKLDGVDYIISKTVNIDLLDPVIISGINPGDVICNTDTKKLTTNYKDGVFSGPVVGGYLVPAGLNGADTVSYKYTNLKTGCSVSDTVLFSIITAPEVSFHLADTCINGASDLTQFVNTTTSSALINDWLWEFQEPGKTTPSTERNPSFLYLTGGNHTVRLTAKTTTGNCSVTKTFNIDLGVRPVADFTWVKDCLSPSDSLLLTDNSGGGSEVKARTWNFFDGKSPLTGQTAKYPKAASGPLSVQLTVNTDYPGCGASVTKSIFIRPTISLASDDYFENFESGSAGWVKTDTTASGWSFEKPNRTVINAAASGTKAWFTPAALTGLSQKIQSSVESPCFDFSVSDRPMISMKLFKRFDRDRDGAVLQYKLENSSQWQPVGTLDDGILWYNSTLIKGEPGGDPLGWTTKGTADIKWNESRHTLDELKGKKNVIFRIIYGSDGNTTESEGMAFDDIRISERSRNVLIEHFVNSTSASNSLATSMVNDIVTAKKEDVINIQYHTNFPGSDDPFYNMNPGESGARTLFYGLIKTPYTFIDGGSNRTDFANRYDYNLSDIDSNDVARRSLYNPKFSIAVNSTVVGGVLTVNGQLTALEDITSDNLTLYLAVTEKENDNFPGAAAAKFYNIFRKFLPDAGGIAIKRSWTKGETFNIPVKTWIIEKTLNTSDIEVIAFVQNSVTKEMLQAASQLKEDLVVGIKDFTSEQGINFALYPNPATNRLTVTFGTTLKSETDIRIYDLQGTIVRSFRAGSGESEFSVDDLGLRDGIYLVRISSGGIDHGYKKLIIAGN